VIESIAPLIVAIKKAGVPIYVATLIACSLLLFLPTSILARLGLVDFLQSNRTWVGVGFIASLSLLCTVALSPLWSKFEDWRFKRHGLRMLSEITSDEKAFLRPYICDGQNTQYAQISDGVAQGLVGKNLIYRAANISTGFMHFPFNLQPYARRLLTEHPHLLD
jgi:superinfection exclusion protein B